jgi:predicted phosphodiesterase
MSMIWGIISDTHEDKMNAIGHIMAEFKKRNVQAIVHAGDIELKHLKPELFNNLPVICALVENQVGKPEFAKPPKGWIYTTPGNRIFNFCNVSIYVGHKRSFEFLAGSESDLTRTLNTIRRDHDFVRWLFSGHTHHQIYQQGPLINFVNPGAVESSFEGYEYTVINTETEEIIFSRIPKTKPLKEKFAVGVISDSMNISDLDTTFWKRLEDEVRKYDIKHVIHCGNMAENDIGREELKDFEVFYNLRPDQRNIKAPKNWHLIRSDNPVVEVNGYRFYVQLDLGAELLEQSEYDMHRLCLTLRRKYPGISFVLCGFTNNAFYEEGEQVRIINPGDIVKDLNFAVISLPIAEITFSRVPVEPLPAVNSEKNS